MTTSLGFHSRRARLCSSLSRRHRRTPLENKILDQQTDYFSADLPGGLDARFCEIMDAAPVMIWVSGEDKNCVWFNRPWLRFTGRSMGKRLDRGCPSR